MTRLELEPYCDGCDELDPDALIDKIILRDGTAIGDTVIRCSKCRRCARIAQHIERKLKGASND